MGWRCGERRRHAQRGRTGTCRNEWFEVDAQEALSQRVLQYLACSDCSEPELESLLVSDWRRCFARNACATVGTVRNSYCCEV